MRPRAKGSESTTSYVASLCCARTFILLSPMCSKRRIPGFPPGDTFSARSLIRYERSTFLHRSMIASSIRMRAKCLSISLDNTLPTSSPMQFQFQIHQILSTVCFQMLPCLFFLCDDAACEPDQLGPHCCGFCVTSQDRMSPSCGTAKKKDEQKNNSSHVLQDVTARGANFVKTPVRLGAESMLQFEPLNSINVLDSVYYQLKRTFKSVLLKKKKKKLQK